MRGPANAHLGTVCCQVRWLVPPASPEVRARVQLRHRHPGVGARILADGARARILFDAPERAVAPGQAAVFYDGDVCLGGGWITDPLPL